MSKITLTDVSSGFQSTSAYNANINLIETDLNDKVLYRDNPTGETNTMQNDLDMNSNDILNTNQVNSSFLSLQGQLVVPANLTTFTGSPTFTGNVDATGVYEIDGTQVVNNRVTGWTAATGTATRTTFVTSTVTTEQLAERVKALIDDLVAHGMIGT